MRRRPLSLAGRITLAFAAAVVAAAAAAGAASRWLDSPWAVAAVAAAAGLFPGLAILRRELAPVAGTLQGLADGLASFRDRDFSLELAPGRDGELGALVRRYNQLAEVLRGERASLFQKEVMLETVLQTTPMAIVLTDDADRMVLINRAARETFGLEGPPLGRRFGELAAACPPAMREVLAGDRDALFTVEIEGEDEVYHLARRRFELNARRHTLVMVKRLTPELRRREVATWKKAIRTISHEVNNSLAPIASLARSARRMLGRPELAERLDSSLAVIEERSGHLRSFLEGYARFARLPRPARLEVEWAGFLAELAELVPFRLAAEPPGRPGRFDPAQVQQALINLLKNARESGSPPDEVAVAVEPTADGGARIRVMDRGRGLDGDEMRRALTPFYSSKPGGSGLGLPLCREIFEAHGGRMRIERRPGGGTAVICWLPGGLE